MSTTPCHKYQSQGFWFLSRFETATSNLVLKLGVMGLCR
jgi:hypothetical protein